SFPNNLTKTNINLTDGSLMDVRGTGGGNITINAQNLNLEAGEFGSSFIRAGVTSDSTSAEAQAGDMAINVAEKITLNESFILNQVGSGGVGNSGKITITTGSL
ncbi:MAG: filamentous hemagglutinin, partial [Cyanobacteria bacterium J06642_3]